MLPLVDKPIIQYGVEEASASGIRTVFIVTGRGKNAIEDHFDVSVELESFPQARGRTDVLVEIRKISSQMSFAYMRQDEPLGLGHAVLAARTLVGAEPFAVVLADDVIDATPPALQQMIDVYRRVQQHMLAVERVPRSEISQYGVIRVDSHEPLGDGLYRVCEVVEKPALEEAPSDLAIVGRYILTPDIFGLLEETPRDRTGEIPLTDALERLLPHQAVCAVA
jgi:UTP--glucose-1-phosphate uridylyltransferase